MSNEKLIIEVEMNSQGVDAQLRQISSRIQEAGRNAAGSSKNYTQLSNAIEGSAKKGAAANDRLAASTKKAAESAKASRAAYNYSQQVSELGRMEASTRRLAAAQKEQRSAQNSVNALSGGNNVAGQEAAAKRLAAAERERLAAQREYTRAQAQAASQAAASAKIAETSARQEAVSKNAAAQATARQAAQAQKYTTVLTQQQAAQVASGAATRQSLAAAASQTDRAAASMNSMRYMLYDVSFAAAIAGGAILGASVMAFKAGITWERQWANVVRTVEGTPMQIAALKEQFIQLNSELPVSSQELSELASQAGQLGIERSSIAEFTGVVARMGATSDISSEKFANFLGRAKALLGVTEPEFEALSSAVSKVGVNSVATESEIVNIATQISSMGNFAGLTADQVVGLSGALASVGAAPEISRGTITRTFTLMSRAVGNGGEALEKFAEASNMSAADFKASWGTSDFAGTFTEFLAGLKEAGGEGVSVLNDLGITSVRDVPLLLRLAQAGDLVKNSFSDAAEGMADGDETLKQYSAIAETTAAKLQILANNWELFLSALTSGGGVLGGAIDWLTDLLRGMTEMTNVINSNPIAKWALGASVALVGLTGVALLVAGAVLRVKATLMAVGEAIPFLTRAAKGASSAAAAASGGVIGSSRKAAAANKARGASGDGFFVLPSSADKQGSSTMAVTSAGAAKSAKAMTTLRAAISGVAAGARSLASAFWPVLAVMAAVEVAKLPETMRKASVNIDDLSNKLATADDKASAFLNSANDKGGWLASQSMMENYRKGLANLGDDLERAGARGGAWNDVVTAFFNNDHGDAIFGTIEAIKNFDDAFASMVETTGSTGSGFTAFRELTDQLNLSDAAILNWVDRSDTLRNSVSDALTSLGVEVEDESILQFVKGTLPEMKFAGEQAATGIQSSVEEVQALEEAVNLAKTAIDEFNGVVIGAEKAELNWRSALDGVASAASETGASLNGTDKASQSLRNSILGAQESLMANAKAMIENGASAEEAGAAYDAMRKNVRDTLISAGLSSDEIDSYMTKFFGSADSAKTALEDFARAQSELYMTSPDDVTITVTAENSSAIAALGQVGTDMDRLGAKIADPDVTVDKAEAQANIDDMQARLDKADKSTVDPAVKAEIAKARASLNEYQKVIDATNGKSVKTQVVANTSSAAGELQRFYAYWQSREINMKVRTSQVHVSSGNPGDGGGIPIKATGGPIRRAGGGEVWGRGTSVSDSIPAWLSNGEFVIRAAAAKKLGMPYLNALNAGRSPKFASGGSPRSAISYASPGNGIVELGVSSLRALAGMVSQQLTVDGKVIAQATNKAYRRGTAEGSY